MMLPRCVSARARGVRSAARTARGARDSLRGEAAAGGGLASGAPAACFARGAQFAPVGWHKTHLSSAPHWRRCRRGLAARL